MTTASSSSPSPHPIVWIAGIAVTLFSLVGIAALTGMLPSPSAAPDAPQPVAAAPATTAAPATVAPEAPAPAKAQAEVPAPAARQKAPAKPREKVAALPPPAGAGVPPDYAPAAKAPPCASCGVIADIREVTHEGEGTGLGAIGGGIVGGALGSNVGKGNGRTLATIAGMVGGGMLGNKIEKTQRATVTYDVSVRMEDGTHQLVSFQNAPPWRIGDAVKVANGTLVAR